MFSRIGACFGTRAARRALLCQAAIGVFLSSPAHAQTELTLDDAIRRALTAAPQTASVTAQIDALNANRTVAGLGPQPTVEVETENFGPPIGDLYNQFQVTGRYSQRIERGGKKEARVALAESQIGVVRAEAIALRLDYIEAVQLAYVEVQAEEAAIGVARQRLAIAKELEKEVASRVASARDPVFAGTRAQAVVAEAEVDLGLAIHARDAALTRLALWWKGTPDGLTVPVGMFLDLKAVAGPFEPSPADLSIYRARGTQADAEIDLQQANAVRDPTISGGPRFIGTGDFGFVASVSIPLGGRQLAEARVMQAQAERRRVDADLEVQRFTLERELALAAEKVEETRHEAEAIQQQVLPKAEQALKEVRLGYNRGFFSFADVTAAETAVANAAERTVEAARKYHEAKVELDRLTGRYTTLAQEALP